MDCFHGYGVLWDELSKKNNIKVVGIDKEKHKGAGMCGDNVKFLKTMDLSKYDIIDLDAYGIPFDQLEEIFKNKTLSDCTVIYTFIQTGMGQINKKLLFYYGITDNMYKKTKVIFRNHGHGAFLHYLNIKGIEQVFEYIIKNNSSNKHYGFFKIKG